MNFAYCVLLSDVSFLCVIIFFFCKWVDLGVDVCFLLVGLGGCLWGMVDECLGGGGGGGGVVFDISIDIRCKRNLF